VRFIGVLFCLLLQTGRDGTQGVAEKMPHCGVAAIYGVAKLNGGSVSPKDVESLILRRSPQADLSALSIKQMREALEDLGLSAQAFKTQAKTLDAMEMPAIVYLRPERMNRQDNIGHVVIVTSASDSSIRVLDLTQSRDPIDVPAAEFRDGWDGEYLAVSRDRPPASSRFLPTGLHGAVWFALAGISAIVFVFSVRYGRS